MSDENAYTSINDAIILDYLEDEVSKEIKEIIEGSEKYLARAQELKEESRALIQNLYRVECPSSQQLTDFSFQILSSAETQFIQQHLELCPLCQSEIAELRLTLNEPDELLGRDALENLLSRKETSKDESILNQLASKIHSIIAKPLLNLGNSNLSPVGSLRGGIDKLQRFDGELFQIVVSAQENKDQAHPFSVIGQIIGENTEGITVQLLQNNNILQKAFVDEYGGFLIPINSTDAEYNLRFLSQDYEVTIESITFTD